MRDNLRKVLCVTLLLMLALGAVSAFFQRQRAGNTSNGQFNVSWNLVDGSGRRFDGDEFNSIFHLTLPDPGRTQTLRGP